MENDATDEFLNNVRAFIKFLHTDNKLPEFLGEAVGAEAAMVLFIGQEVGIRSGISPEVPRTSKTSILFHKVADLLADNMGRLMAEALEQSKRTTS